MVRRNARQPRISLRFMAGHGTPTAPAVTYGVKLNTVPVPAPPPELVVP
jgi:hypothetical protein